MHSESSGKINYWPGFVDAFSNLVLALVFVIVILAMSLGMFSGLMAKMAIQRALIDQQLKESKAMAQSGNGTAPAESAGTGAGPTEPAASAPTAATGPQWTEAPAQEAAGNAVAAPTRDATPVEAQDANAAKAPDSAAQIGDSTREHQSAPVGAGTAAAQPDQAALRQENDALRQEIAALRKKNATLIQAGTPIGADLKPGVPAAAAMPTPSSDPKSAGKFGPTMPESDRHFNQRIEDDLQRALKEFEAQRDNRANINVVIYVPNYALTENKRTALFYLISIKDYLMKRKVSSERIRMHMTPAPTGQKDMSVSISVEP